ncbi:hypothetical protein KL86CLO1_11638 [uncultured Eubacteriales bacterium]|uniref:Uncharacterized protein n=1 Tax=uncultured Eubacteriales bacterium TaxID=172733 RepID=A0A212JSG4_9FIRM|nr:hypothetical protein KL86CLO1_11638 [uncultured Eubacteriales bacterium]
MALDRFEKDMKIIAALDDEPNDVGGLSAAELKERFDEGGEALKDYINNTLLPALETAGVFVLVPNTRKINGKALSADVVLVASDVGAVPTTRTVNGKVLSTDITLSFADVGAVPTSRNVNGKPLATDIAITTTDIGAVPTSRTINGKGLSANIALTAADVGALAVTGGGTISGDVTMGTLNASKVSAGSITSPGTSVAFDKPISAGTITLGALTGTAGTITANSPINMSSQRINSVGDPILSGDAANKLYVDAQAATRVPVVALADRIYGTQGSALQTTFSMAQNNPAADTIVRRTSTGTVRTATPTADNDAATKAYADTKLSAAGGAMAGMLNMGSYPIAQVGHMVLNTGGQDGIRLASEGDGTVLEILQDATDDYAIVRGIASPVGMHDAANKGYVDDAIAAAIAALNL